MAKKKTKRKAKKAPRDPEAIRRTTIRFATTVGALGALGAGAVGLERADDAAIAAIGTTPARVRIGWPGIQSAPDQTWMPPSERARLLRLAEAVMSGGSPLEPDPLREASNTLYGTGWFKEPPRVSRDGQGVVHVTGAWRIPAVVVRSGSQERLIAWDGVVLPLSYDLGASRVRFLIEPRFGAAPPVVPGATPAPASWPGEDVPDALALLDLLDDDPAIIAQIHGLDLNSGGPIEIVTDTGSRIRVGTGPLRFQPGDVSIGDKLNRLRALLERNGRIDGNARLIEIDGPNILFVEE